MKQLTSASTINELAPPDKHSLLFFSASWCAPCLAMKPVLETVSGQMGKRINTIKIDVDASRQEALNYGIRNVPTVILIKNNEIISQQVGGMPAQELTLWLEQYI